MPAVYVTKERLIARYGEDRLVKLTDRVMPYTNAIVDGVLDEAIASAVALIDLHIGGRCQLPLVTVPKALEDIAAPLTLSALHIDQAPDKVTADFQQAMRTLRDIRDGSLTLDVGGTPPPEPASVGVETVAPDRLFGRDNMRNW